MAFQIGCQFEPEDKWPVIVTWDVSANLNIKCSRKGGVITLKVPDSKVDVFVDVRTFNANQQFTVKTLLQRVRKEYTVYYPGVYVSKFVDLPPDELTTPTDDPLDDPFTDPTEPFVWDGLVGTYQAGSGHPPQGVTQLKYFFYPAWLPLYATAWYWTEDRYPALANRYVYLFEVIIEDAGGRTDTFDFTLSSTLIFEE
jgi:hypothetical protein